jgi:hypothetical protein
MAGAVEALEPNRHHQLGAAAALASPARRGSREFGAPVVHFLEVGA